MDIRTPESMGIPSGAVEKYIRSLDDARLATHDIIISRGESIVFETYVKPFEQDMTHRMYSVTKSLVSLAVGFALDDGLLSLDDPMEKYFSAELEGQTDMNLRRQTVRNMLMMATAKKDRNWFRLRTDDRVRAYFQNPAPDSRPGGSFFEYDSTGSFVMCALVERLTGMKLMEYLRVKLFDKIGVGSSVRCLACPGGHSWGDSASLMTPRNLWLCARFVLNGGSWNGEQLISRKYMKDAVSALISTDTGHGYVDDSGYGYYIWKAFGDGFYFSGMGCQFAVCVPEKDMILIYNGDNQGNSGAYRTVIHGFYDIVVPSAGDVLPEDPAAHASLLRYAGNMELFAARSEIGNGCRDLISGRTYILKDNPMGITQLRFTFSADGRDGVWSYTNRQGDKVLAFGICRNDFGYFPEEGYSDAVGSQKGGRLYRCAASGAWETPDTLWLKVQIIDDYFGNFDARFTFSEDGKHISVSMKKTAEDFLEEYKGNAEGEE